jgi:hypothetical protein
MNTRFRFTLILAVLAVAAVSALADPVFRVGAASVVVNPPQGAYLAGYDTNRKSTGVHDDLFLKAVIFDDGKTPVALIVVDTISLPYPLVQQMRQTAAAKAEKLALPAERIICQATHSHCTPDTIGIYGPSELVTSLSGANADYLTQLVAAAGEAVGRAVDSLQPAKLAWAETQCKGWAVNDSEPQILDNSVTILECLDASNHAIATLTNFACHPTVLDNDTTLTSADWVGAFYKKMQSGLSGQHMFLQGAIGGWVQPKTPERTFALAEKYGDDLAEKALAALKQTQPINETAIRFAHKTFGMPVANPRFRAMSLVGLVQRDFAGGTVDTEVAWFSVGPAQFATHLGETAPEYALETRKLMQSSPKFVLGLGLDHLGYIVPPRYFDNTKDIKFADYLIDMSPGREAGPTMMKMLEEIIPKAQ